MSRGSALKRQVVTTGALKYFVLSYLKHQTPIPVIQPLSILRGTRKPVVQYCQSAGGGRTAEPKIESAARHNKNYSTLYQQLLRSKKISDKQTPLSVGGQSNLKTSKVEIRIRLKVPLPEISRHKHKRKSERSTPAAKPPFPYKRLVQEGNHQHHYQRQNHWQTRSYHQSPKQIFQGSPSNSIVLHHGRRRIPLEQ